MGRLFGRPFSLLVFVEMDAAGRRRPAAVVASLLAYPGSGAPRPLAHRLSRVVASLLLGQFARKAVLSFQFAVPLGTSAYFYFTPLQAWSRSCCVVPEGSAKFLLR